MIKVAQWGTGEMGRGLLNFILDRPKDLELVGCVVTNPAKVGKTVGELVGRPCPVVMTADHEAVLVALCDLLAASTAHLTRRADASEAQLAASRRSHLALVPDLNKGA